jgi:hypothetical protein
MSDHKIKATFARGIFAVSLTEANLRALRERKEP